MLPIISTAYSTLFTCLYDETFPIGKIGKGTHYSIFRSIEWFDLNQHLLDTAKIHDFAVIWDEDHDIRIISVIQSLYLAGLSSQIQFIGEHKGVLTIIVSAEFFFSADEHAMQMFIDQVTLLAKPDSEDKWPVEIGHFDPQSSLLERTNLKSLIKDSPNRADIYVRNISALWSLGIKDFVPVSRTVK